MATRGVNPSDFIFDNTVNSDGGRYEAESRPHDSPSSVLLFEGACYVTSAESINTVHYGTEVNDGVSSS